MVTDQTPEARLAAAIIKADGAAADHTLAEAILAADPTLADDLALAAAVRRMGDDWWLDQVTRKDGFTRFAAHVYPSGRHGTGPTLVEAIEEALRDD